MKARSLLVNLPRTWLDRFREDGFVSLGTVLTEPELRQYQTRFDALFYATAGDTRPEVRDLAEMRGRPAGPPMLQRINLWEADELFRSIANRADLFSLARSAVGTDVRLFRDQGFYKPGGGSEIYLHQDNRYWHLEPAQAVTIWIALDDTTVTNGCVHYVRGSHRFGAVKHNRAADGASILLEVPRGELVTVPVPISAGACVMHHCLTLHGSAANTTQRPRRAYSLQYAALGAHRSARPAN